MTRYWLAFILILLLPGTSLSAQIRGCPDRLALNYNTSATLNDGSCLYNPANIKPMASLPIQGVLAETSGLIFWNDLLWTHNDNLDTNIYSIDTVRGSIVNTVPLANVQNIDWEEISQDNEYVYIGDFGNNYGNRKDLKILRISKASLTSGSPVTDTIGFSYSDQTDFEPADANQTDFDCEAFIVSGDSLYLFTKQWTSRKTGLYSLPKVPGSYIAKLKTTYDVKGLITGSVYIAPKGIIVLTGYSRTLDPFLYLLYDFKGNDFFSGNKRKLEINLPSHQIEGIASSDGIKYYATNEHFSFPPLINVSQKIHIFNLSSYLGYYAGLKIPYPDSERTHIISPVPVHDQLKIRSLPVVIPSPYALINLTGRIIMAGTLDSDESMIDVSGLSPGTYILRIGENKKNSYKLIKD
ncbi:MAG: T9SS type A sorting domain-containing protein [Bacteroidales bacterium]|nr:T9SS type A sorting domain-containing protein [Bacteroidales bacterium]